MEILGSRNQKNPTQYFMLHVMSMFSACFFCIDIEEGQWSFRPMTGSWWPNDFFAHFDGLLRFSDSRMTANGTEQGRPSLVERDVSNEKKLAKLVVIKVFFRGLLMISCPCMWGL